MILTSVDLPAPFSPSRASTEPPMASRSTPWRTSTPPNDLRMPLAWRAKVMRHHLGHQTASAGRRFRVDVADVVLVDDDVFGEDVLGDRLALERLHHVRDEQGAVALGEVRHRRDVVRVAGDVLPDGGIRALAAVPQVGLATERIGGTDRSEDAVLVDGDDDDPLAWEGAEQVGHLLEGG